MKISETLSISRREFLCIAGLVGAGATANAISKRIQSRLTGRAVDAFNNDKKTFFLTAAENESLPKLYLRLLEETSKRIDSFRKQYDAAYEPIKIPPTTVEHLFDVLYMQQVLVTVAIAQLEDILKSASDSETNEDSLTPERISTTVYERTYRYLDEQYGLVPVFEEEWRKEYYGSFSPGKKFTKIDPLALVVAWLAEPKQFEQQDLPEWLDEAVKKVPLPARLFNSNEIEAIEAAGIESFGSYNPHFDNRSGEFPFKTDILAIPSGMSPMDNMLERTEEEVENLNRRFGLHEAAHVLDNVVNPDLKKFLPESVYFELCELRKECRTHTKSQIKNLSEFPNISVSDLEDAVFDASSTISISWLYTVVGYPISGLVQSGTTSLRSQKYASYDPQNDYMALFDSIEDDSKDDDHKEGAVITRLLADSGDMSTNTKLKILALAEFQKIETEFFAEIGFFVLLYVTGYFVGRLDDEAEFLADPHYKYFSLLLEHMPPSYTYELTEMAIAYLEQKVV